MVVDGYVGIVVRLDLVWCLVACLCITAYD